MEVVKFVFASWKYQTKLKIQHLPTIIPSELVSSEKKKATAHYCQLNENMFSPCPSKQFDKFDKLSIQVSLK